MLKVHVVLKIAKLSGAQIVVFANHILSLMTGNANFTSPFPALSILSTAINNLNAALTAQQKGNKASTQNVRNAKYQVQRVLKAMAAYVEFTCNDNASVALTSGFSLSTHTNNTKAPLTPIHGINSGQIDLRAKAVADAGSYIYQYTQTPLAPASWITAATVKQAKHSITGLTPGVMYYFRVAVVTKTGQQPWSNAVNIMVL